jgi:hypothetical protein
MIFWILLLLLIFLIDFVIDLKLSMSAFRCVTAGKQAILDHPLVTLTSHYHIYIIEEHHHTPLLFKNTLHFLAKLCDNLERREHRARTSKSDHRLQAHCNCACIHPSQDIQLLHSLVPHQFVMSLVLQHVLTKAVAVRVQHDH